MPPKPKFTKEEITDAALKIVSEKGIDALTAKELGTVLGSSARPIFTVFKNMNEVQDSVRCAAFHRFEDYAKKNIPDIPLFKQIGVNMVMFAINEPMLYRLIFMHERENAVSFDDIFTELGTPAETCIKAIQTDYDLSLRDAKSLFENVWIYTFGIGTLCATKACCFSEETLQKMLSSQFKAIMLFIKQNENRTE